MKFSKDPSKRGHYLHILEKETAKTLQKLLIDFIYSSQTYIYQKKINTSDSDSDSVHGTGSTEVFAL